MFHVHKYLVISVLIFLAGPWTLFAQSGEGFDKAVHHFYMNEYDQALQLLDQVESTLCGQDTFLDECIQSKIIRGNISRNRREFEKAQTILEEGLMMAQTELTRNHPLSVHLHVELAYLEADQSSYEEAKEWADSAIEIVTEFDLTRKPRARAYLVLGFVNGGLGDYSEAVENYQEVFKSLEEVEKTIEIKKLLTQTHNNIGVAYRRLGKIEEAMAHYQSTLKLVKETFGSNHLEMGYAYNSIGTVYYFNGDFGTAADYFQQASDIFRVNLGENSSPYAASLNNIATAYYNIKEFGKAAEILEKAQRIKENTLGKDHQDTAVGYSNLAQIYEDNKDYEAALRNHENSLYVRRNIHGSNHPNLVAAYISFGKFYVTIKEYENARQQYLEAERIIELRLGQNHPDIWEVNNEIGRTYHQEKKYDKAISYFQKSLYLMRGEKGVNKETYNFDSISYPYIFLETITGIGDASLEHFKEEQKFSALQDAYYFFMWASDIVNELQTEYQSEASKLNLIDQNYSIYTSAIETCNYLFQETSEQKWLDEILKLSELSRSRIALELLQELQAKSFAGVPEEILTKERSVNTKIADYYQQLHTEQEKGFEADQQMISAYRDSLFNTRQSLKELTKELEQNYPAYYQLKYDQSFADREMISDLLGSDETLVNYVVSEDQVYALVLDKVNISFHPLGASDSLAAQVKSLREAVLSDNIEEYSDIAHKLYQKLLDPIVSVVESGSLVIVPDQMLHYLPFELLLTERPESGDYYTMPYLVRETQISYVPSATVLQKLAEQKLSDPRNLFAVAPFNEGILPLSEETGTARVISGLSPLPLTQYETREIAGIFSERRSIWDYFSPEKADILLGRNATKSTIKNTAFDDYGFIHFATHAFVNENDPALSGIAFWGEENEDGMIYVNDIYNMKLNADLVVLGACDTGLGTVYKGEGMIGFTRAFIYAGATNLMVSMWRVNDQPTAHLMIQFYKYAKEGYSYSESLRMAKMDLIDQPDFASPRHWAAFVLQGR